MGQLQGVPTVHPNNPIASQSLESAFVVDDNVDGWSEDLFDEDPDLEPTWVFNFMLQIIFYLLLVFETSTSEPESPIADFTRMSLSDRISDVLEILRGRRLSPFDLILQILDEDKHQYAQHRNEFYKESNQKLFKILNIILANNAGKRKLRTWIRQAEPLNLVCDIVSEEMTCLQEEYLQPGISAITPEFIKTWTISPHRELAPYLTRILLAAAQTTIAKEKNKKKKPEVVRITLGTILFPEASQTARQARRPITNLSSLYEAQNEAGGARIAGIKSR